MKLRSGVQVGPCIAQNPKLFQPMYAQSSPSGEPPNLYSAEHNASSPFLMLPQEIKNRIYDFVCGGHMVHIKYPSHHLPSPSPPLNELLHMVTLTRRCAR